MGVVAFGLTVCGSEVCFRCRSFRAPLHALEQFDEDKYYETSVYDGAINALAPTVEAILGQLERCLVEERGAALASGGGGGGAGVDQSVWLGLPVAAPFSLVLYEVLLDVVFVSEELAEGKRLILHLN